MRVKISYSTDIEDLPKEISDVLDRSIAGIYEELIVVEDMGQDFAMEENRAYELSRSIDELRKYLAKFDIRMQEIESLLMGYLSTANQDPQPTPQPQVQSPEQIRKMLDDVQAETQEIKKEVPRVMSSIGNEKG